ncbi:MAG TPA: hypothetical protein PLW08_01620 [Candidatus Cloacimonas acidaminovorans]|nr:hypothetical protein [Candidatus Cloacimonas acidaminovorans]
MLIRKIRYIHIDNRSSRVISASKVISEAEILKALMTPDLNFYGGFTRISTFRKSKPSTSLCRPDGLLKKGKEKRKNSGLLSSEGLTPPSLLLFRPSGFLAKSEELRAESVFPFFNEGLTPPSLSLFRPSGF